MLDLDEGMECIHFVGVNGSGKTTLLESIYLMVRGRTFRGRKAGSITTEGERRLRIEGRFGLGQGSDEIGLVFERAERGTQRWLDGVEMLGERPWQCPVRIKLIGENPQSLWEGEPVVRRGLLDWNVFHVEHQVGRLRMDLRRVLGQRNAALRMSPPDPSPWDASFLEIARRMTEIRAAFMEQWRREFVDLAVAFSFLTGTDLHFERGWSMTSELVEALAASRVAEIQRGQTLVGPHRADFSIRRDDRPLRFSRGQAKVVVLLLQLAAERVHRAAGLSPSLWLLDDLESELDDDTNARILDLLNGTGSQRISTHLPRRHDRHLTGSTGYARMFHVEHGCVSPWQAEA